VETTEKGPRELIFHRLRVLSVLSHQFKTSKSNHIKGLPATEVGLCKS